MNKEAAEPATEPVSKSQALNKHATETETRADDVNGNVAVEDEDVAVPEADDADTTAEIEDAAEVEEAVAAPSTPGAEPVEEPIATSKRTSRKKASDKTVAAEKPKRASRRGALAENVAR